MQQRKTLYTRECSISFTHLNDSNMKIENTKAQMRKGVLEFVILQLLSQKEMYPSDIIGELKESKLIVVEGTLYPLLTRLKNAGLLDYRWEESKTGPPRKYYKLTELGEQFLSELSQTWNELIHAVKQTTTKD
ncbi:MAG TPA: PadR family transcriptional regulator [Cryomorphaceae bacterium]|nr:PadR family transcriptional regulator [Cryomorphaceae bacterium]